MTYVLLLLLLIALEYGYFGVADRFNIIDRPNERSSHTQITLRGGGIIFPLSVLLYTAFWGLDHPYFVAGLCLICGVSFADDIRSISSRVRIVFHFAAMLLMFHQWGLFHLYPLWYILIALIFCTGILNAYNFMDGINGITGGYSLVAVLTLLVCNRWVVPFVDFPLLYVLVLALLVFCFFNFRPKAKCFAGDVGSVGIAFILLYLIGRLVLQTGSLYWLLLLAIYGVDSILTIVHRLMLHENIFQPHRKHAYQILANELHVPHVKVSALYMGLQLLVNAGAVALYPTPYRWGYWVAVIVLFCGIYVWFVNKYFKQA